MEVRAPFLLSQLNINVSSEGTSMADFNLKNPYDPNVSLVHSEQTEPKTHESNHTEPEVPCDWKPS